MDPHFFLRIRIHAAVLRNAAFLMQIRIQLNKIWNKLPHEELKKTKKIAQKL